jgi:hypothetical protein
MISADHRAGVALGSDRDALGGEEEDGGLGWHAAGVIVAKPDGVTNVAPSAPAATVPSRRLTRQ